MVVKLTQEQANYLKTFGNFKNDVNKKHAVYYISRFGWGHEIKDGFNKKNKAFDATEQLKMVDAVINGYEVIVPKFKFHNFSNISGLQRLYYAEKRIELTADITEAKEVEKNSKEYVALENLGFFKEEV